MALIRAVPAGTFTALLVWAAVLVTAPRYFHQRRDIRLTAFWYTQVLLALALTLEVPPVYVAFDHLVGLSNAARWLSHACVLGGAYLLDTFFFALTHAAHRLKWHRPWLLCAYVLSIVAMAVLLWRADLPEQATAFDFPHLDPWLVVYRLVYVTFLGLVLVRLIRSAASYRRQAPAEEVVQVGMGLLMFGGFWGLAYCAFAVAVALTPTTASWTSIVVTGVNGTLLLSVLCVVLGATIPEWGRRSGIARVVRHLRVLRAHRRLGPVWCELSRAFPAVVLPMPMTVRSALLRPRDMELRLRRRVIEILDARRLLQAQVTSGSHRGVSLDLLDMPFSTSGSLQTRDAGPWASLDHTSRLVGNHPTSSAEAWLETAETLAALSRPARLEAMLLRAYLGHSRAEAVAFGPTPVFYQPRTYEEAVAYLGRVARALREPAQHRRQGRWTRQQPRADPYLERTTSGDE